MRMFTRSGNWAAHIIPDKGDGVFRDGFRTMEIADATARGEAKLILQRYPEVNEIEVVVTYEHEAILNRKVRR